jgi:hypothetical protein
VTDRIVIDLHPGLVDRVAEWLFPWLGAEAAAVRSGQPAVVKGPGHCADAKIGSPGAEASAEIEISL